MGKKKMTISFRNATIDSKEMKIIVEKKDETKVFNLQEVLDSLHGVEGLTVTFAHDTDIKDLDEDY